MKRAASRKRRAKFLGTWIPKELLAQLDKAVEDGDTDRSKFVRGALKEKVARTKIAVAPADKKS